MTIQKENTELIPHDCPAEEPMLIEKGKPGNWCAEMDDDA